LTVVVLANSSPETPGMNPPALANDIALLFVADKLDWRPSLIPNKSIPITNFDALMGRYDYGGRIMTFFRDGDRPVCAVGGKEI